MDIHALKYAEDLTRHKEREMPASVTLRVPRDKWIGSELVEFNGYFWAWTAETSPGDMLEVRLSHPRVASDFDWP